MSSISEECEANINEIAIFTTGEPINQIARNLEKISPVDLARKTIRNVISEQQIFTDLPDF